MEFTDEQYRQVIHRVGKMVPFDLASASSVAVLIERGSQLGIQGSGTLFRIAEESFVITAAHVIKDSNRRNLRLAPGLCYSGEVIPLDGEAILDERDEFDIAAVHLKGRVAERIDPKRFLRLNNISFAEDLAKGLYAVFGYPEMMFSHDKDELKIVLFYHGGPVYAGETSVIPNFDASASLLLDADIDETRGADGKPIDFCYPQGPSAPFPTELKGISGGSVWRIMQDPNDIRENPEGARIVAIEVAICQPKRCIRATRWKAVKHMLQSEMPRLRPAIDIWRPA
ncbi:MAG TPA: hypothetical protein VJ739_10565 [Gemmataceae bacterium]|nr:hypothetical protein [Gemmataceae bacterium]